MDARERYLGKLHRNQRDPNNQDEGNDSSDGSDDSKN
ncbi:hypothetical protein LMG23992_04104 [Cupriavidus laharis]|uniref:Uncharacterized protein n=1 Tax=Cupriavidus laharis TaxID=151654 RepID=A0ABM8XIA2_9BURK|nr:hypothetical protein LMG23992_04104 [Cupriavidus laharis]